MDDKQLDPPSTKRACTWPMDNSSWALAGSFPHDSGKDPLSRTDESAPCPYPVKPVAPIALGRSAGVLPDYYRITLSSLTRTRQLAPVVVSANEQPPEPESYPADVSIVIVNYNSGLYLSRCLESCIGLTAEIVVVDNASTDDSMTLALNNELAKSVSRVIVNKRNIGFSRACNQGAAIASANYLLFLNPDCVLDKQAIKWLLRAANAPDIGMVGGLLLNSDGTEQAGGRRAVPTPWRTLVRAFGLQSLAQRYPRLFDDFLLHQTPLPENAVDVEAISGACMLVSRQALKAVGPLDEGYFMHCEDLDWCMRFRSCGLRIVFQPRARVVHYKGRCSVDHPFSVEWHKHRGMMRFYKKFFRHQYPGILMTAVSLGVWLRFCAVSCYLLVQRPWKIHDEYR